MSESPNTSPVDQPLASTTSDETSIDFSDPTADPLATASSFFDDVSNVLGRAEDSLASAGNSFLASTLGVTQADVDAGKINPATLSREQRAQLAIDGATGGVVGINPWSIGFDLDPESALEIAGGGFVLFEISVAAPLALADKLIPPRFALLADDKTIIAQGTLDAALIGVTPLFIKVLSAPAGLRLTLWTDSTLVANFVKVGSLADLSDEVARENTKLDAASPSTALAGLSNKASDLVDKFFDVQAGVGLLLVAVVGVALFLFIDSGGPREVATALRTGA